MTDFTNDENVDVMTPEEIGGYVLLLCRGWREGGSLPNDERKLARISRLNRRWNRCRENILNCFAPAVEVVDNFLASPKGLALKSDVRDRLPIQTLISVNPNRLANRRQVEELAKALNMSYKQWVKGKQGGRPPKPAANPEETRGIAARNPDETPQTMDNGQREAIGNSSNGSHTEGSTVVENFQQGEKAPHTTPPIQRTDPEAFKRKNDQVEVLNKCERRPAGSEHPAAATFFLIGRHVPDLIITKALAKMQDERINSLNPDHKNPIINLTAFYLGLVSRMCEEEGVETPINWTRRKSVSSMDPNEIENQDAGVRV